MKAKKSRKNDRRKHQRMWTLSEVNKLVDGISDYGVGRWTDIKRVLFPFSSYRTPIDLRVLCKALFSVVTLSSTHAFTKCDFCRISGGIF